MEPTEEEKEAKIKEDEINDVLGDFVNPVVASGEPEEKIADEPVVEEEKLKDEVVEKKEEIKPVEVVEAVKVVEKKVEVKVDDEREILKRQNELLLKRVEELSSGRIIPQTVKSDDKKVDEKVDDLDVIGDLDIDEVVSDKKLFNQVISNVIKIVREQTKNDVLAILPQNVSGQVSQQMRIKSTTDAFYNENKDLVPVKQTVAYIAAEIYAGKPDITMEALYVEAAKKTREILGMREPVAEKVIDLNVRRRSPEFPSGSRGGNRDKKSDSEIGAVQKDINETLGL